MDLLVLTEAKSGGRWLEPLIFVIIVISVTNIYIYIYKEIVGFIPFF